LADIKKRIRQAQNRAAMSVNAEIDPTNSIQSPQKPGETQIMQRIVAQLPWAHNVILIQKIKDLPIRLWYARQAIAEGWSEDFWGFGCGNSEN
jgi:predicted nuclease of restriction endonuclease-like (RecB) superfamily